MAAPPGTVEYVEFEAALPNILAGLGLQKHELTFSDYLVLMESFITE